MHPPFNPVNPSNPTPLTANIPCTTHPQYRLIFGFHWLGGNMDDVATGRTVQAGTWDYYGLRRLADENAIFVAPNGLNAGWGNAGGEDVAFVDALARNLEDDLCVNPRLRFATGFNFGGAINYAFACSRNSVFCAVSVIAGGPMS